VRYDLAHQSDCPFFSIARSMPKNILFLKWSFYLLFCMAILFLLANESSNYLKLSKPDVILGGNLHLE
jgi:hypothetical protein